MPVVVKAWMTCFDALQYSARFRIHTSIHTKSIFFLLRNIHTKSLCIYYHATNGESYSFSQKQNELVHTLSVLENVMFYD